MLILKKSLRPLGKSPLRFLGRKERGLAYLLFLIMFSLLNYSHCLLAQQAKSSNAQLDKIKIEHSQQMEARDEYKRKWVSADEQAKSILEELQELESELSEKEQELFQYETDLEASKRRRKELKAELATLQNNQREYRAKVAKRVRAMYKFAYRGREYSALKVLLGADSITDLLNRYKYISVITKLDRNLLIGVQTQKESIEKTQIELSERDKQIIKVREEAEKRRGEIITGKKERGRLLKKLQKDKGMYNKAILELEDSVAKLEKILITLGYKPDKPAILKGFSRRDLGNLPMPLSGDIKIIDNLAKDELGITIVAKKGADIHCIADGEVAWLDSMIGYGNLVIVYHGRKYFSVYAHVSEILVEKGERVRKEQIIAKVGDTGSIIGPMFYLELWKDRKRLETRKWLAMKNGKRGVQNK